MPKEQQTSTWPSPKAAAEELQLATPEAPDIATLERLDAPAIWKSFRDELEKIKSTAETLTVTSVEQKKEMALARDTRLALKKIRVAVEHKRKELVEGLKKKAGAIDGDAREIRVVIERLESRLEEQEQFIIRNEEERVSKLQAERSQRLLMVGGQPNFYPKLGEMPEEGFAQLIEGLEVADRLRKEREAKAEVDRIAAEKASEEARIAKEKADAEERSRIAAENEKLRKEAAEKEAALKAEREAAEKTRKEAAEAARKEALRLQAIADKQAEDARLENLRIQRVADEEKRQQIAAHKAELDAAEAARKKVAAAARAEQARLQAIADAAELEARTIREAKERAEAEDQAARAAAAKAPDREKLKAFATALRAMELPLLSKEGSETVALIMEQQEKFAKWVEKKALEF